VDRELQRPAGADRQPAYEPRPWHDPLLARMRRIAPMGSCMSGGYRLSLYYEAFATTLHYLRAGGSPGGRVRAGWSSPPGRDVRHIGRTSNLAYRPAGGVRISLRRTAA
jgi:hypothetical protein